MDLDDGGVLDQTGLVAVVETGLIRPASKRDPVVTEEIEVALVHINNPTGHSQQLSSSIMGIAGDSCAFRAAATIIYQIALLSDADLLVVAGTSMGGTAAQHVAARQDDRGVYNRGFWAYSFNGLGVPEQLAIRNQPNDVARLTSYTVKGDPIKALRAQAHYLPLLVIEILFIVATCKLRCPKVGGE